MSEEAEIVLVQPIERGVKTENKIFLSHDATTNLVCIQGMRLYYSPSDICKFIGKHAQYASNCLIMLAEKTPTFVVLLKTKNIENSKKLVSVLNKNRTPICSLDELSYSYVKSYAIESERLSQTIDRFLNDQFYDSSCAICLCALVSDMQLITLCCGHTMHAQCAQKMKQFECPLCRYTPISALNESSCEVCGSFDKPFICLCCARCFCYDHCLEHFKETGHGYCASTDGKETWNLMSGTTMKRIAVDKSGEYVEMCAKEDVLRSYLDSALYQQLAVHREIAAQKNSDLKDSLESDLNEQERELEKLRKQHNEMKTAIENKEIYRRKLQIARSILEKIQEKQKNAAELGKQLEKENKELEINIAENESLLKDMEGTACISAAAALKGKDQEVHICFTKK